MQPRLTLYTRDGCHLCERMLAELHALFGPDLVVDVVNIDERTDLARRYGDRIPVLVGAGRELCMGRLDLAAVEAYFSRGSS